MDYSINQTAFEIHEDRANFLDNLAVLAGCTEKIGHELPDGLRPDVMRIDRSRNTVFIGEAKNTESPGCNATKSRLRHYIRWLAVQTKRRRGMALFGICHARLTDGLGWINTILHLARQEGLILVSQKTDVFGPSFCVQIFVFI